MRQNSIAYPGERAPRRPAIAEQAGYTGKNYYEVEYHGRRVTVHASDELAALFTAAKHWGYAWTRPEYHQSATAIKLRHKPDGIFG